MEPRGQRWPCPRRIFFALIITVTFRLAIPVPFCEASYLIPEEEELLLRQKELDADEDVSEVPFEDDVEMGWDGMGGEGGNSDEEAVLTGVAYRLMMRKLRYRPEVLSGRKDKRKPGFMALDNIDFAITTLDSNRNNRRPKGGMGYLSEQRFDTQTRPRQRGQRQNPTTGRGTLATPALTNDVSSSRLDRLVLKVSAKDIRKMFQLINAGKRSDGWTD